MIDDILIISDDLTSAGDSALPFLRPDRKIAMSLEGALPADEGIRVVDLATRSVSDDEAYLRVRRAVEHAAPRGLLFKNVDSTLRGHVSREILATVHATGRTKVVFAPAFPEGGRTTQGGRQFVGNIPVDQSDYAKDPVHPVRTAQLGDLLPSELGAPKFIDAAESLGSAEGLYILDCVDQFDLNAWIDQYPSVDDTVFVGSPGLATALGKRYGGAPNETAIPKVLGGIVAVGSYNPVSRRQYARFKRLCGANWQAISTSDIRQASPEAALSGLLDRVTSRFETKIPEAIVATGGETMAAILRRLGVNALTLVGQMAAGFPIAEANYNGSKVLFAMKAGGFGGKDALIEACDAFSYALEVTQ